MWRKHRDWWKVSLTYSQYIDKSKQLWFIVPCTAENIVYLYLAVWAYNFITSDESDDYVKKQRYLLEVLVRVNTIFK